MSSQVQPSICSKAEVPAMEPKADEAGTASAASTPLLRATGSNSLSALTATSARTFGLMMPISVVSTVARTAATSTMPARPEAAPPRKQAVSTSGLTGSPARRAARALPPTMRRPKPQVVCFTNTYMAMQKMMPKPRPQWTSSPGKLPSMLSVPMGCVEGLLRLAGSRSGPSTMWLNSAMAM